MSLDRTTRQEGRAAEGERRPAPGDWTPMKNNQARLLFRIPAAPVAVLACLAALVLGFQAIASGDFKRIAGVLLVCLLALLFTLVACATKFRGLFWKVEVAR